MYEFKCSFWRANFTFSSLNGRLMSEIQTNILDTATVQTSLHQLQLNLFALSKIIIWHFSKELITLRQRQYCFESGNTVTPRSWLSGILEDEVRANSQTLFERNPGSFHSCRPIEGHCQDQNLTKWRQFLMLIGKSKSQCVPLPLWNPFRI